MTAISHQSLTYIEIKLVVIKLTASVVLANAGNYVMMPMSLMML